MKIQKGFTLIELMVTLLISSIVISMVMKLYSNQYREEIHNEQQSRSFAITNSLLTTTSNLISFSEYCTNPDNCNPVVTPTLTSNPDSFQVNLKLSENTKVFPNNNAPYDEYFIKLVWDNNTGFSIASSNSADTLDSKTLRSLLPLDSKMPAVINFEVDPLDSTGAKQPGLMDPPVGGYRICITTREGILDASYSNPDFVGTQYEKYRTYKGCTVATVKNANFQ